MTNADTLIELVVSFLGVVLPALAGYLVWIMKQRMAIQQNAADATLVDRAAGRAGGLAFAFHASRTGSARNDAVAAGVDHITAAIPDALARLNVDGPALHRMVSGELGKLEANRDKP